MARFSVQVDFVDNTKALSGKVKKSMNNAMTDVVLDVKRVASMSAPHDTGFLEKSATHQVFTGSQGIEGTVGFSAVDHGFNYAKWTHDEQYKLGEKSKKKKGGKSKFGGGSVPVGRGYLDNALKFNEAGYMDHLREAYHSALD